MIPDAPHVIIQLSITNDFLDAGCLDLLDVLYFYFLPILNIPTVLSKLDPDISQNYFFLNKIHLSHFLIPQYQVLDSIQ